MEARIQELTESLSKADSIIESLKIYKKASETTIDKIQEKLAKLKISKSSSILRANQLESELIIERAKCAQLIEDMNSQANVQKQRETKETLQEVRD